MLRFLNEHDVPQLLAIEGAAQSFPWTAENFKYCLKAHYVTWVLEKDGAVIGFIVIHFGVGEVHVLNLCVHPSFQHQGYGQELLSYALSVAKEREYKAAYLEVRRSNEPAIALYRKLGFDQIGERKNYYLSPQSCEDALIFAKAII